MLKQRLVYGALFLFIAIGALLVIGEQLHWWHLPVLESLGEAVLIAGLLGLTVDHLLKVRLVKDIAEDVLGNLWGIGAPQEYLKSLNDSLSSYKAITLSLNVEVTLDWQDDRREAIRVTSTTRTIKQNISNQSWHPDFPWVAPSVPGSPGSSMKSLELIIRRPASGQRAPVEIRKSWGSQELADQIDLRRIDRMAAGREFIARNSIERVVPGGTCEARFKAVRYRYPDDMMPFWSSTPALSWMVTIKGNALSELDVRCYAGTDEIQLTQGGRPPSFEGPYGFTHAGVALQAMWKPKDVDTPGSANRPGFPSRLRGGRR
ncbi:hypothetical protein ACKI1S_16510 [Streptomyces galilaeus]|uniref:Uncharacterized protein n=1 Tax=Streptomyces galilaeus TaxID=33899 RepID=A0ABW9IGY1_STRGJ